MELSFLNDIVFWIITAISFFVLFIILSILIFIISRRTHALIELKASMSGRPIALFFQDNKQVEWCAVKVDAGIIEHKDYGCFIINNISTYTDKKTKGVIMPFDANFAGGINVKAAKLIEDLQYVTKDEQQMKMFRQAIAQNAIDETDSITAIKSTVNFSVLKTFMTAIHPHSVNAKIEKTIAARIKNYGGVNVMQVALLFGAMLGAILLGAMIIKLTFP